MNDKALKDLEDGEFDAVIDHAVNIIYPVFKHHGFTWSQKEPTRMDIEQNIRAKIEKVFSTGHEHISSGRISVIKSDTGMLDITLDVGTVVFDE